jgi:hypothetical protein
MRKNFGELVLEQHNKSPLVQNRWSQLPTIPFLHWFIEQLVALHNAMKVGAVRWVPADL